MKNKSKYKIIFAVSVFIILMIANASAQNFSIEKSEIVKAAPGDTITKLALKVSHPELVYIINIDYQNANKEFTGEKDSYFAVSNGKSILLVSNGKEGVPLTAEEFKITLRKKQTSGYVTIQVLDKSYKILSKTELTY